KLLLEEDEDRHDYFHPSLPPPRRPHRRRPRHGGRRHHHQHHTPPDRRRISTAGADEEEAVEVLRQHRAAADEDQPAAVALQRRAGAQQVRGTVRGVPGGAGAIPGPAHLQRRLLGRRPGSLLHAAAVGRLLHQHHLHQVDPADLPLQRQGEEVRRRVQGLQAGEVVEASSLRLPGPVHRPARAQVQTLVRELAADRYV
ncbi:Os01g0124601, partial [Oryza sativa Japonica Group]